MVSKQSIHQQLKKLDYNYHGWGRTEVSELPNIILPEEEIHELVNGIYEGGFAMLVATNIRVLLVDKKPLNYLTVEDMRFDMISEMDYSHRLLGATVSISSGNKNLVFRSYNQPRLRKLISHVQHAMAETKKQANTNQEGQNQHLEQINQQLQTYLMAQYQHQLQLQEIQRAQQAGATPPPPPPPVKPAPELSDYLFAQSLLSQHKEETGQQVPVPPPLPAQVEADDDLLKVGQQEVFGNMAASDQPSSDQTIDMHALRIAYSKLPMALRNRKFGRPSFHAHSEAEVAPGEIQSATY